MPVLVFHRAGQVGTGDGEFVFFSLLLSIYVHMEREHGDFLSQGRVIHGGAVRGVSVRVASWISPRRCILILYGWGEVVAHHAMHVCVQRAGAKEEGRSEVTLPEGTIVLRLECRRLSPGVEGAGAV